MCHKLKFSSALGFVVISCIVWRPGAPLKNFNDGGSNRGSHFIPKRITTSEFVYPKESLLFLKYQKKSLSPYFATPKIPLFVFFATKKNPGVFQRPKKSLLAKISDSKKSLGPPPPPSSPPSLKYVSGAPGVWCIYILFKEPSSLFSTDITDS